MSIDNDKEFQTKGKFLSLMLRHRPDMMGLEQLEPGGWVDVETVLDACQRHNQSMTFDDLTQLVRENNKRRYSFDYSHKKIRANQGHSVPVDLQLEPKVPPRILFHGTVKKAVPDILREGIKKMYRHAVHLSHEPETAEDVGSRRGEAAILNVRAHAMHEDGFAFYCSDNGVWLTDHVPADYISLRR